MMEEACLNVALNSPPSVVEDKALLNSANPLLLLSPSIRHVPPHNREVDALLPQSSVASPTAEAPPLPEPKDLLPLTSVASALRLLSSVVLPLPVLISKVNAAVPLLLLACVPPPPPPPDVTSLSDPEDLIFLRVPTDVMPHPVAVPAQPTFLSIDVVPPLVPAEVQPHRGL